MFQVCSSQPARSMRRIPASHAWAAGMGAPGACPCSQHTLMHRFPPLLQTLAGPPIVPVGALIHANKRSHMQAGFAYMGGKMDDITVVVGRVADAAEVAGNPLPGQGGLDLTMPDGSPPKSKL